MCAENFIKVLNPSVVEQLAAAGFSYIFKENDTYVYEYSKELEQIVSVLQHDDKYSNDVAYVVDDKLRF